MLNFRIGGKYSRADVKEIAGVGRAAKGGPWDTGIVEHDGEYLIFANVGAAGRTGTTITIAGKETRFAGTTSEGLTLNGPASRGY